MDGTTQPTCAPHPRPNHRVLAKAATRRKVLDAATALFLAGRYDSATIRDIAAAAGMSTGAVFANFSGKADLWRAAMGCEPPVDGPAVRAALAMLSALRGLVAVRPDNWDDDEDPDQLAAWTAADAAIALAEGRA